MQEKENEISDGLNLALLPTIFAVGYIPDQPTLK